MTNELIQKIAAGALAGLFGAMKTDLDAWGKNPGTRFDWSLALRRWIEGAASGAVGMYAVALGMGGE